MERATFAPAIVAPYLLPSWQLTQTAPSSIPSIASVGEIVSWLPWHAAQPGSPTSSNRCFMRVSVNRLETFP